MAVRNPLDPPVLGDPLNEHPPFHDRAPTSRPPARRAPLDKVAAVIGYGFTRPDLLSEALTHRSAVHGRARVAGVPAGTGSNERLEFIGDRVLGLLMAEWLAERFPREQEGDLGRRLGHLVAQPILAEVATSIGLAAALDVSPGEARAGVKKLATVLADAMEAVIGAIYLDGGIPPARDFVRRAWHQAMEAHPAPPKDAKTSLQEWAQKRSLPLPLYRTAKQAGPSHNPIFTIEVTVAQQTGVGTAGAKRGAEQLAAADLLKKLKT